MEKDYRISYIRALSTLMVVSLHVIQKFSYTYPKISAISDWLNLGLVFFFLISAYLYSKRDIKKEVRKKWLFRKYTDILVPSLTTVLFAILIFGLCGVEITGTRAMSSILCGLGLEAFVPNSWVFMQYWFLTYILIFYTAIPIIQKIDFKKFREKTFWAGVFLITIAMQGILSAINSPISWGGVLRFLLPYAMFRRYDAENLRKTVKVMTIIAIPCVIADCYVRYFVVPAGIGASVAELAHIYIQTLAGTSCFYWLYDFFGKIKVKKKLLKITDRYSYPVYLTHSLFIGYSTSIIDKFENRFVGTVVALLLTVVASVLLSVITTPIKEKISLIANKKDSR